jgi:hypothetical protein
MITKCANPACGRPFQYLRGGRLYCFELRRQSRGPIASNRLAVYFWICDHCADSLSLEFDAEKGVFLKQSWANALPPKKLTCQACKDV